MSGKRARKPVLMECTSRGCPRKKRIDRDDLMPAGTVRVTQPCPWHERSGDKDGGESYFNTAGEEI